MFVFCSERRKMKHFSNVSHLHWKSVKLKTLYGPFSQLLQVPVQSGCTLPSTTINGGVINATGPLNWVMRERKRAREGGERTFRQTAVNYSNTEGKPKRPKQTKRSILAPVFICAGCRIDWCNSEQTNNI